MSKKLTDIKTWSQEQELHVVVESPRNSSLKFKYEPKFCGFTVSRAFPLGVTYPFDWGFIPGTCDEDGDPVDALIVHDVATYPGIILPCRVLGMLAVEQKDGGEHKRECNNRIIAMPTWHDRFDEFKSADDLPQQLRQEIEQFFLNTTLFTAKKLTLKGWKSPIAAINFINSCGQSQ
jgi:inorganic pyrophosphatase